MFYKFYSNSKKYNGKKTGNANPAVKEANTQDVVKNVSLELTRIISLLSKPTDENNQVGFFMDNVAPAFCEMKINTVIGDGPRISVPTSIEAQGKIREWNSKININGDTVEDWMRWFFLDNIQFNRSYARIMRGLKGMDGIKQEIDVQRLDPKTITPDNDSIAGWRKFIQTINGVNVYKNANAFMNDDIDSANSGFYQIKIADDPKLLLHGNLFVRAPMDAILAYIILKYWILTFMKKYADKSWSGLFLGFIGDPKTSQFARDRHTMQDAINKTTVALDKLRNFGSATFAGDTRIEQISPPNNGSIYTTWFDKMDESIMLGLYSSMSARQGAGVYKGTENPAEENTMFIKGIRDKLEKILKRFYINNITPELKPDDIVFSWNELRVANVEVIASAIEKLSKLGVFIDADERRRAASQIFTWLSDRRTTPEDIKYLDKQFIELNKPSAPKEGNEAKSENNSKSGKSEETTD